MNTASGARARCVVRLSFAAAVQLALTACASPGAAPPSAPLVAVPPSPLAPADASNPRAVAGAHEPLVFDRAAAGAALDAAARESAACIAAGSPRVEAHVKVTFAPSGLATAAFVDNVPLAGTPEARCIGAAFQKVRVPPFEGEPVGVGKTFTPGVATRSEAPPEGRSEGSGNVWGERIGGDGDGDPRLTGAPLVNTRFARLTVTGGLPPEVVARIVRSSTGWRACYADALRTQPGLRGSVELVIVIDRTGRAQEAAVVNSTLNAPNVERCLIHEARRLTFPQPEGGSTVTVKQALELSPAAR